MSIQTIVTINLFGLVISYLSRYFIKNDNITSMIPNVFLYVSTVYSIYLISQKSVAQEIEKKEVVVVSSKVYQENTVNPGNKLDEQILNNGLLRTEIVVNENNVEIPSSSFSKILTSDNTVAKCIDNENSFQFSVMESEKPLQFTLDGKTLKSDKLDCTYTFDQDDKYLKKVKCDLKNNSDSEKILQYKILMKFKSNPNLTLKGLFNDKVENLSEKEYKSPGWIGASIGYLCSYVTGNFGTALVKNTDIGTNLIIVSDPIKVPAHETASFNFSILNCVSNVSTLDQYSNTFKKSGSIVDLGFFAPINKICLIFMEYLSAYLPPVIVMIIFLLLVKIITFYPNYVGYLSSRVMSSLLKDASSDPVQMQAALQNGPKPDFLTIGVTFGIKIISFIVIYSSIKLSPIFFNAKFFWINDISGPDPVRINNLFGLLSKDIPFIPTISLLPSIAVMFIVDWKAMRKNQGSQLINVVFFVLINIFFSGTACVICLYFLFNALLEKVQNRLFKSLSRAS